MVCAEHVAQLCQRREELDRLNVTVLLISFGPREKAGEWLEEMCPSFQLLIDTDYNVYGAYNLKHSRSGSWNLKTLFYYIRILAGGTKWRGIIGDSTQLGGDFIINRDGSFQLEYPSKMATDRPSVPELMDLLKE
ncbi:MAG: peroxiredoxin-like family protein [Dehalococcoidales bacterium]